MDENEKTEERLNAEVVEQQLEDIAFVQPKEGGAAWKIVFGSFLSNLIVDGVIFTAGSQLIPVLKTTFQASDFAVSLIFSILSGCYLFVGPLASVLSSMYGCRKVVLLGCSLSFFGFLVSTVAINVPMLYIFMGFIPGIGFGLVYLPSIVIISQYFSEKRSLANGIAVCGSGIGTTLFSEANPHLMTLFGGNWHLFCVYLAVACLFFIIAAWIFKPLEATEDQIQQVVEIATRFEQEKEQTELNDVNGLATKSVSFDVQRPFLSTLELNAHPHKRAGMWSQRDIAETVARESIRDLNRPLARQDVFYPGSTSNLRSRSHTVSATLSAPKNEPEDHHESRNIYISSIGLPTQDLGSDDSYMPSAKERLIQTLRSMLDPELLKSPSFMLLALSGTLTMACFYVPYNYINQHLNKIPDLSDNMKSLPISFLGIVNIIARIFCGYISDIPAVDPILVSTISLTLGGLATCAVPFFAQYWLFIAWCVPFAFGVATFAALRTIIALELFGLEKLSNAFGILLTFMGFGAIVGSPIAAIMKDATGNYDVSFYVMGAVMAVSGLMLASLRPIRNWELKRYGGANLNGLELQPLNQ